MNDLILTILGTRPQFIKASMISRAIEAAREAGHTHFREEIIDTGQHYDHNMSAAFISELGISAPVVTVDSARSIHGTFTTDAIDHLEQEISTRQPAAVIVYGDTYSTLAGTLATGKAGVPLAHVEAGLRSHNTDMAEEYNRVKTDHASALLFCPCEKARENLRNEGITQGVHVTGDVMYDAFLSVRDSISSPDAGDPYAVATIHRAENTDNKEQLAAIVDAFRACPLPVLLILHPRTRKRLSEFEITLPTNVQPRDPVGYREMLGLVAGAAFVISDSGGLQKEAFFLSKRCVIFRDETEWGELVEAGVSRLTGLDPISIAQSFDWASTGEAFPDIQPYGDGTAAKRIVSLLLETFR